MQSHISKSRPIRMPQRARAVSVMHERGDLSRFQTEARASCRAILFTDISEFYHSIYTHSIPWAFHTKAVAKTIANQNNNALLGNRIDKLVRKSQDSQTMGIPIGPDTSFIIAEAILAATDVELANRVPNLKGFRWIDEYELSFRERSAVEDAFAAIEQILLEYELRLNPRKTRILDLPVEFEPEWVQELRAFRFRSSAMGQANDLTRYFDAGTRYLHDFPTEHVPKYAAARIRTLPVLRANHELYQSLLCQCMSFEPGATRECIQALHYAAANHGLVLNLTQLEQTINTIIEQNAPIGHDYEVAWCLWAALTWGIPLSSEAAEKISEMENSVVAILALDAEQQGLFAGPLDTTHWQARMTGAELYEEEWLLSYEANLHNWLPSAGGGDHVAADPGFSLLKAHGVHFYTPTNNPFVPGALQYP